MGSASTRENRGRRASGIVDHPGERAFRDLRFESSTGGLILLGPTSSPLSGMSTLLASPEVEPVESAGADLLTWTSARNEVISLTRQVSAALRNGKTAVVYLDAHLSTGSVDIPEDRFDFVCARVARILFGISDRPAYVIVHGQQMANALRVDSAEMTPTIGMIADYLPVVELAENTMFAGTPVAVCSSKRAATAVAQALDWFEARRQ